MNFQEIVSVLADNEISKKDFADGYMSGIISIVGPIIKMKEEIPQEYGGGEYYVIWQFADHGVFIKLRGWYSSYNDIDFDGYEYEQVEPKTRIITYFE